MSIFRKNRRRSGMTLVETLNATFIMGLAAAGMITFLSVGLKMYYVDRARLMINRDIRTFTQQLDTDAVTANYFVLFQDFNNRTTARENGEVGDFLLLVYTDPSSTSFGVAMITKIVFYYREVTDVTYNRGPVHRKEITLSTPVSAATTNAIQNVMTANITGSISSYPVVTLFATGLEQNASNSQPFPMLFYNFNNTTVMIGTQISESLTEKGSTTQTGNTYNFSVSPRG